MTRREQGGNLANTENDIWSVRRDQWGTTVYINNVDASWPKDPSPTFRGSVLAELTAAVDLGKTLSKEIDTIRNEFLSLGHSIMKIGDSNH
ncbi:putative snf2 family helicase protein [Zalerion maritima]|uniref:Snf2 family helicase protein n=1 Tax=Zalerion maritima TaxID=339359 RepID=A0AAD5RKN2_9PEZI|nr:putative snf2 family helicase protein [Zalerion maritima]